MALTSLAGTKWTFGHTALQGDANEEEHVYNNISFRSNGITYSSLTIQDDMGVSDIYDMHYGATLAYDYYDVPHWSNDAYRTVEFLDGADLADEYLLRFVENNATQIIEGMSVDLSTLSGWEDISVGTHTLRVKAKATGYRDSALSAWTYFFKTESGGINIVWSAEGINCDAGIAFKEGSMADFNYETMVGVFGTGSGSFSIADTTITLAWWGKYNDRSPDEGTYQINNGEVIDARLHNSGNPLTLTLNAGDTLTLYSLYED